MVIFVIFKQEFNCVGAIVQDRDFCFINFNEVAFFIIVENNTLARDLLKFRDSQSWYITFWIDYWGNFIYHVWIFFQVLTKVNLDYHCLKFFREFRRKVLIRYLYMVKWRFLFVACPINLKSSDCSTFITDTLISIVVRVSVILAFLACAIGEQYFV